MILSESRGIQTVKFSTNQQAINSDVNALGYYAYQNAADIMAMLGFSGVEDGTGPDRVISGLLLEWDANMDCDLRAGGAVSYTGTYYTGVAWGFQASAGKPFLAVLPIDSVVTPDTGGAQDRVDTIEIRPLRTALDTESRSFKDPITGIVTDASTSTRYEYACEVQILKGTEGGSPVAPATTAGWIKVAEVSVAASQTVLAQTDIKDVRDSDTWTTDADGTKYASTAGGGVTTLFVDQHIGIGVTSIKTSSGTWHALEFPTATLINNDSATTNMANNAYYDGAWKYKSSDHAARFQFGGGGQINFYQAPSGTVDNSVSWTNVLSIAAGSLASALTIDDVGVDMAGSLFVSGEVLGVGTTSAHGWPTDYHTLEFPTSGVWGSHNSNQIQIHSNAYFDSIDYKRIAAGFASRIAQLNTGHIAFEIAGTSTADSVISWTTAVQINAGTLANAITTDSAGVDMAGTLNVTGTVTLDDSLVITTQLAGIRSDTLDGSDDKELRFSAGGGSSINRGASIRVHGNEHATDPGVIELLAGNVSGGVIKMQTAAATAVTINESGNVGVGTTDIESWGAGFQAVEFPASSLVYATGSGWVGINSNAYYDGAWKYKTTNLAQRFVMSNVGTMSLDNAISGTADTAITWKPVIATSPTELWLNGYIQTGDDQANVSLFSPNGTGGQSGAFSSKLLIFGGNTESRHIQIYQDVGAEAHIVSTFEALNIEAQGAGEDRVSILTGEFRSIAPLNIFGENTNVAKSIRVLAATNYDTALEFWESAAAEWTVMNDVTEGFTIKDGGQAGTTVFTIEDGALADALTLDNVGMLVKGKIDLLSGALTVGQAAGTVARYIIMNNASTYDVAFRLQENNSDEFTVMHDASLGQFQIRDGGVTGNRIIIIADGAVSPSFTAGTTGQGFGTTDIEAWAGGRALQLGPEAAIQYNDALNLVHNLYYDTNWKRRTADVGSLLNLALSGAFNYYQAATGTIDSVATLTSVINAAAGSVANSLSITSDAVAMEVQTLTLGLGTGFVDRSIIVNAATGQDTALRLQEDSTDEATLMWDGTNNEFQLRDGGIAGTVGLMMEGTNVGIGTAAGDTLSARLTVEQDSTTAAAPVLLLDQSDISEELIRVIGSAAVSDLTQTLIAGASITALGSVVGAIKVYIQDDGNQITDGTYYIPFYTPT